ncbi:MAG: glycoside hydrolase family 75 protein [Polyangiaceae bacterium]
MKRLQLDRRREVERRASRLWWVLGLLSCSASAVGCDTGEVGEGGSGASAGAGGGGGSSGSAGNGFGGSSGDGGTGAGGSGAGGAGAQGGSSGSAQGGVGGSAQGGSAGSAQGGSAGDAGAGNAGSGAGGSGGGPVTAQDLLALTSGCSVVGGDYATDSGGEETVPICELNGALFWTADMDIDCDGYATSECNENTDPWYQDATSMGDHIAASVLPYVVIPSPSGRFDYRDWGIELGAVVAVIYDGQVRYGAFVDTGPEGIIGEASYAMADLFGIDPDPASGGTPGPVTYIVFTDSSAVVPAEDINDHSLAESLGASAARAVVDNN